MALTLRIRDDFWDQSMVSLEVDTVGLDSFKGLSIDQIRKTEIWQGNRKLPLGEAFDVNGSLSDECLVWQGDLTRVHWIGARHSVGCQRIEGSAGRHIGSQMTGGEIHVQGSVGDFAGVEMTGGTLRIDGDAGNRVAARYPGSAAGMNRGLVIVGGNVGKGLGENMRRGTVLVLGDASDAVGWNLLAGTICVMGTLGRHPGAGMVRGSIICASPQDMQWLPTFFEGPTLDQPQWMRIFSRWLDRQGVKQAALLQNRFRFHSGDHLYGGRGEVWVAAS